MSSYRGAVVVIGAAVVLGLAGCGGAAQADGATAQEKGKAACDIVVALDFKHPTSVHFVRETDKTKAEDDGGWTYSGALQAATDTGEMQTYVYACVAGDDGKLVMHKAELATG